MLNSARWATPSESIPPRLLRAYRLTRYRAEGFDILVGRRVSDGLFARIGARNATLVTAWNPMSRRMPQGWNGPMQRRLLERLRRVVALPAEGTLGRWHEAMVLVAGDVRPVLRLACVFRQRGVVVLRRGQSARLITRCGLHSCAPPASPHRAQRPHVPAVPRHRRRRRTNC